VRCTCLFLAIMLGCALFASAAQAAESAIDVRAELAAGRTLFNTHDYPQAAQRFGTVIEALASRPAASAREEAMLLRARCLVAMAWSEGTEAAGRAQLVHEALTLLRRALEQVPAQETTHRPALHYWAGRALAYVADELRLGAEVRAAYRPLLQQYRVPATRALERQGREPGDIGPDVYAALDELLVLRDAVDHLHRAASETERGALNYDARLYRALALGEIARSLHARAAWEEAVETFPGLLASLTDAIEAPMEKVTSDAAYRAAISELTEVARSYTPGTGRPSGGNRPIPEVVLTEYHRERGHYELARREADLFARLYPQSRAMARVRLWKADSLYYSGRLEEAVSEYMAMLDDPLARPRHRLDALLGTGWCHARLAATLGADRRRAHLTGAAQAFDQAEDLFQDLAPNDNRRLPALYKLAETRVALGEERQALDLLDRLSTLVQEGLTHGALSQESADAYRLRHSSLAGAAAEHLGRPDLARTQFLSVQALAAQQDRPAELLEAVESLARIEMQRGRPDLAALRYDAAVALADPDASPVEHARARLGSATARLALAQALVEDESPDSDARPCAAAALLLATAHPPDAVSDLVGDLALEQRVARLRESRPDELLAGVIERLDRLLDQQAARLRVDGLYYHQGAAYAALGRYDARQLLSDGPLGEDACRAVLDRFDRAIADDGAFMMSLKVNPRGAFAARAMYGMGRALADAGEFTRNASDRFQTQREQSLADLYRHQAQEYLAGAVEPLQRCARTASGDELAVQAHELLGRVFILLDRYGPAENVYRALHADPAVATERRESVALELADLLVRRRQPEEALALLETYLTRTREAVLATGEILEDLGRLERAHTVYSMTRDLPSPTTSEERARHAQALYRAQATALTLARGPHPLPSVSAQDAIDGLRSVAETYPRTLAGAQALGTLGRYALDQGEYERALYIAQDGRARFENLLDEVAPGAVDEPLLAASRHAMLNLAGEILRGQASARVEAGDVDQAASLLDQAEERFREVITDRVWSPRDRTLHAKASLKMARVLLARADLAADRDERRLQTQAALRQYADVYATYADETVIADDALFEAADEYRRQARPDRARALLHEMHDAARARTLLRRLEATSTEMAP